MQVVLQYAHDEWSSATSSGLMNVGLSSLTESCAGRSATVYDRY